MPVARLPNGPAGSAVSCECLNHRAADFIARQAGWIVAAIAACGSVMLNNGEGDHRGDRKGKASRLDKLRDHEIPADPVMGQAGIEPWIGSVWWNLR